MAEALRKKCGLVAEIGDEAAMLEAVNATNICFAQPLAAWSELLGRCRKEDLKKLRTVICYNGNSSYKIDGISACLFKQLHMQLANLKAKTDLAKQALSKALRLTILARHLVGIKTGVQTGIRSGLLRTAFPNKVPPKNQHS
jgi:hypothetical protein